MRRKTLYISLVIAGLFCIVFWLSQISFSSTVTSILAFPFEQIGGFLRFLFFRGRLFNGIGLMLYVGICLIPIWTMLWMKNQRKLHIEDGLLGLLSFLLFVILYGMINFNDNIEVSKLMLGVVAWSVIVGYAVLRILRLFFESDKKRLQNYLRLFLIVLAFLFVFMIFGLCLKESIDSYRALKEGNKGNESTLSISYIFLLLQFIVNMVPYALNIRTIFFTLDLLDDIDIDQYSEDTVVSAEKLSIWCKKSLSIVVVTNIFFNVSQLIFVNSLRNINTTVSIPIISICFVLGVLIIARIIVENRKLKSDNDLFI